VIIFAAELHRDEIADVIANLIAELGDTADAIAYRLTEAGITGQRADAECCPIANYLRRHVPCIDSIAAYGDAIEVNTHAGQSLNVRPPEQVAEFMTMFDQLRLPHLITRPEGTR